MQMKNIFSIFKKKPREIPAPPKRELLLELFDKFEDRYGDYVIYNDLPIEVKIYALNGYKKIPYGERINWKFEYDVFDGSCFFVHVKLGEVVTFPMPVVESKLNLMLESLRG